MKIEHIAFLVNDPVAVADWYGKHLGLRILRKHGPPTHAHFLADDSGQCVLEVYTRHDVAVPEYRAMSSMVLHVAFMVDNVQVTIHRLAKAGATPEGGITRNPDGDELGMVRDPWGFAVQLVHRTHPMC